MVLSFSSFPSPSPFVEDHKDQSPPLLPPPFLHLPSSSLPLLPLLPQVDPGKGERERSERILYPDDNYSESSPENKAPELRMPH